jgi:hypothetical protein
MLGPATPSLPISGWAGLDSGQLAEDGSDEGTPLLAASSQQSTFFSEGRPALPAMQEGGAAARSQALGSSPAVSISGGAIAPLRPGYAWPPAVELTSQQQPLGSNRGKGRAQPESAASAASSSSGAAWKPSREELEVMRAAFQQWRYNAMQQRLRSLPQPPGEVPPQERAFGSSCLAPFWCEQSNSLLLCAPAQAAARRTRCSWASTTAARAGGASRGSPRCG